MISLRQIIPFVCFCAIVLMYFSGNINQIFLSFDVLLFITFFLGIWLYWDYRFIPSISILILFTLSFYISPIPFIYFDFPIVPYLDNVDYYSFTKTYLIFSMFLSALVFFVNLSPSLKPKEYLLINLRLERSPSNTLFWIFFCFMILSIIFGFRGESIVNISGNDEWSTYGENLEGQGGILEYFFILLIFAYYYSYKLIHKLALHVLFIYYIYFTFTRGFRIMLLEVLLLTIPLYFEKYLTSKRIIFLVIVGFFSMQAIGALKHGMSDISDIFSLTRGLEVRTTQTEIFYSSNGVISALDQGFISIWSRIESSAVAIIATAIPASFLPNIWHTTIAAQNISKFPAGGGGFIAGHFYFWGGILGVVFSAWLVSRVIFYFSRSRKTLPILISILLLTTFPRWVAYEPVALFFRSAFYFAFIYLLLSNFFKFSRSHGTRAN